MKKENICRDNADTYGALWYLKHNYIEIDNNVDHTIVEV